MVIIPATFAVGLVPIIVGLVIICACGYPGLCCKDKGKMYSLLFKLMTWVGAGIFCGLFALYNPYALIMINIFKGKNYWNSWEFVFEERKTSQYFKYAIGDLSNVKKRLTFITWIF